MSEWRRMYIEQGITLEEAAKEIGISKKSLDDYFLQLRNGHLNGFNFNEHKNDKIGILRSFNKQKFKHKQTNTKKREDVLNHATLNMNDFPM